MAARRLTRGGTDERQDDLDVLNTLLARGRLNPEPEVADDHGDDCTWSKLTTLGGTTSTTHCRFAISAR
jgi:hypothetical protein